jgi:hypothetical protein
MLVYYPFKLRGQKIIMKKRKKFLLIAMALCAFIFNSHSLLTSGVEPLVGTVEIPPTRCVTVDEWFNLVKAYVFFDAFLSIIFPFVIIGSMNLLIVTRLIKMTRNIKSNIIKNKQNPVQSFELKSNINKRKSSEKKDSGYSLLSILTVSQKQRRIEKYIKSCRMLFMISTVFIVLNLPIAICKMRYSFQAFESMTGFYGHQLPNDETVYPFDEIFERISCYMFYLNFSLNFLFYILSVKKFNFTYIFFKSIRCVCVC